MIDLSPLARRLAGTPLADWANTLQAQLDKKMEKGHGDLERWQSALDALPKIQPSEVDLLNGLKLDTDCSDETRAQMRAALMGVTRHASVIGGLDRPSPTVAPVAALLVEAAPRPLAARPGRRSGSLRQAWP